MLQDVGDCNYRANSTNVLNIDSLFLHGSVGPSLPHPYQRRLIMMIDECPGDPPVCPTDVQLSDRVNELQRELVDLRQLIEPFLTPVDGDQGSPQPAPDPRSPLEEWISSIVDVNDSSLAIVRDIRERLYMPSALNAKQYMKKEPHG